MSNKVSLFNAAKSVSNLLELLENELEFDQVLRDELIEAKHNVAEAVDRRKYIIAECDSRIEAGKKMIKDIQEHMKRLDKTRQKIKKTTLEVMEMEPDQRYEDSLGRKLSIRTSQGKLEYSFDTSRFSLGPCVPYDIAKRDDVNNYIIQKCYYILDTDKITSDLKAGKILSFCRLVKSKFISGL